MPSTHAPTLGVHPDQVAPGVHAVLVEHQGVTYIPYIAADTPGNGDVGRYLDSLPKDRTIRVPCVLSSVLKGMLRRRGYRVTHEWSKEFEEEVEVFERRAMRGGGSDGSGGLTGS